MLVDIIFFVSTSHPFLNYLLQFLLLLLPRERVRRESLRNPIATLHVCEIAEKGRSEIRVMGKNIERQRNGCRKSVLGKTQILGSMISVIVFCKSVTISS